MNTLAFNYPAADATTLMGQASMTAHDYMLSAKHDIDEMFGKGFAMSHPELICAYMQAAAMDFSGAILAKAIGAGLQELAQALAMERSP